MIPPVIYVDGGTIDFFSDKTAVLKIMTWKEKGLGFPKATQKALQSQVKTSLGHRSQVCVMDKRGHQGNCHFLPLKINFAFGNKPAIFISLTKQNDHWPPKFSTHFPHLYLVSTDDLANAYY